jgi:hypothetical protein
MSTLLAQIFSRQFTITLVILYLIIGLSASQITISSSWAETAIPSWIKNNAGWWASGMITEDEFLKGIEYLINNNIILIYDTTIDEKAFTPTDTSATKRVPDWVKNNAGWWAEDLIKDYDFLNGIKYLINKGVILVSDVDKVKPYFIYEGALISNYWKFLEDRNLSPPVLNFLSYDMQLPNGSIVTSIFDIYGVRNDFTIIDDVIIWNVPVFGLNANYMEEYNEIAIWDDPQKAAVVFPIFTDSAYDPFGFYDYYRGYCDSCTTTKISDGELNYNSSVNGYQLLTLLGYSPITDIDIDKNPSILKKYDKIVMLHNEYVTRAMFDAITSHPNVIYLYPNALYAEIEVDYDNNTITLIRGHNYPEQEIVNGFDWEFENTHPYEYDNNCQEMKFYKIDNGWQTNCYPEKVLPASPDIFKVIKEL